MNKLYSCGFSELKFEYVRAFGMINFGIYATIRNNAFVFVRTTLRVKRN